MDADEKRTYKNRLYEQFALLGKALAAPRRNILSIFGQFAWRKNLENG